MYGSISRRQVLRASAATGAMLGLGDLGFLARLSAVSAAEAKLEPNVVQLRPEIEPLVRVLEETPRSRLLEEVADRIRRGLSYRELLAALLLAGVKNVEPRPSVGHKFHTVLVVNSAHLASMASPPEHRWLPIFWALDYYKAAEARDVEERGDWTMSAVDESAMPPAHKARDAFNDAMENWDEAAADAAVAALARTAGANEIYELFFRFGMRDFRSIGHKAIYVANSCRTLGCIGWQHAEPVLRSLAYALLMHEGDNPAKRDDGADRPFRRNQELAKQIRPDWRDGKLDGAATKELLGTLRTASNDETCDHVVEMLNRGVAPQSIWDALHVGASELLMRQPGIVAIHAVTSTNALSFAYQASANDETRRLLLLQNAAFLPMFRAAMGDRGRIRDETVDTMMPAKINADASAIEQIFADLRAEPMTAASQLLGFLKETSANGGSAKHVLDAARMLVFLKGDDAHDYKFSSAILEDYYHVSSDWRDLYLAANLFQLPSSVDRDNSLVERTRAALRT
ncbi:MAG: twin-arginine translocation signal domain-containing protein [Pirellulales bacterium]